MVKRILKGIGKAGVIVGEKALSELALFSAVCSTAHTGNYAERIWGGISGSVDIIKNGIEAYVGNEGVRDTLNSGALKVMSAMGDIADNITDSPDETLYAAAGTYAACKTVPYITSKIRKKIKENRALEQRILSEHEGGS